MNEAIRRIPEVKYHQFYFFYLFIANVVWIVPFVVLLLSGDIEQLSNILVLVAYGALLFPFAIYHLIQLYYYKNLVPTHIQIVTLDKVESSWKRHARFLVELDFNGYTKKVYTKAIFKVGMFGPNDISEYSQKKAKVGFDEKRGYVVILELLE